MTDQTTFDLIKKEVHRQQNTLMMIPSENYTSVNVLEVLGSSLTNKYSEGYAKKRYYQGNQYIDEIELLAIERAKKLFHVPHANVQPYSGSPANAAIYFALLQPGDTLMGLRLSGGGHLTHGHPDITFSGKYFTSVQFEVDENGWIDMEKAAALAQEKKPKLIIVGTTAYPRQFDWQAWRSIADSVGAYLCADISHIAGLVATDQHPSPVQYAHVVMATTHKTLRGPRGAIIMVTEEGIKHQQDLPELIDRAVFPGLQGGPHNNVTAAISVALYEAMQPEFQTYGKKIIENARELADKLTSAGLSLVTGGTDNHLMVIDLRPQDLVGNVVAEALEQAGIVTNRNAVPSDPNPPFYPSGIRLGTPAVSTRGMGTTEMALIAYWIASVVDLVSTYKLPQKSDERKIFMKDFRKDIALNNQIAKIRTQVTELCNKFPIYS